METPANTGAVTHEPWEQYDSPEEITEAEGLSAKQKTELFQIWINEVEERLDAASEGMPPHGQTDDDANLLENLRVELQKAGRTD